MRETDMQPVLINLTHKALGYNNKSVQRVYAKQTLMKIPSVEENERVQSEKLAVQPILRRPPFLLRSHISVEFWLRVQNQHYD
jgi:hypothetical protein